MRVRRRPLRVAAALLALLPLVAAAPTTAAAQAPMFTGIASTGVDTSGTPAAVYRLPALAHVGGGHLVACYDSRNVSGADLANNIDIVCRRSLDHGATWSPRWTAVAHTGGNTPSTASGVGDPQLTWDAQVGKLVLHYLSAPPGVGYNNSTGGWAAWDPNTVHPQVRTSGDLGATWSAPIDLTATLKNGVGGALGIFASGGKGVQLADGTLVAPFSWRAGGLERSAAAYSTDHGATWAAGTQIGNGGVGEHHVVQLADGSVLSSLRTADSALYRKLSTAPSVTGVWTTPKAMIGMPDPGCNGDVIRVDTTPGSPRASWLLASNPDSQTSRVNLVVRLSKDNGLTWPYSLTLDTGPAGYSTMVPFGDGSFGILYENAIPTSLKFTRFSLAGNFAGA